VDAFTLTCIGLRVLGAAYLAMIAAFLPALAIWLPRSSPGPVASLALFAYAPVAAISIFLVLFPGTFAGAARFGARRDARTALPDCSGLLDAALRLTGVAIVASGLPRIAQAVALIAARFVVPVADVDPYSAQGQAGSLLSALVLVLAGAALFCAGSSLIHQNGGHSHDAA